MLTISNPLSAGRAQAYHAEEFANAKENYYTQSEQIRGEWHGRLAEQWGLRGEVRAEHFHRLSEGQHPTTGEQLVRHQTAREYVNERGEKHQTMEHRAGWDATFSAPKSISLTALVGGDDRVREAHQESVTVALDEMERYVQARRGGAGEGCLAVRQLGKLLLQGADPIGKKARTLLRVCDRRRVSHIAARLSVAVQNLRHPGDRRAGEPLKCAGARTVGGG